MSISHLLTYRTFTKRERLTAPPHWLARGVAICLLVFITSVAFAQNRDQDKTPVQAVIQEQIDAFLADDFETAFQYAAPNIQRMFGHPRRFAQMIVRSYPMVWRPVDVKYLGVSRVGPYALQKVMIIDQNNALHILRYQLVPINQRWRISGVEILEIPGERI